MSYSTYRTSSAPSRGRGFSSRGSYRGRGGGDGSNSSWNSTSPRGRGGSSRGRFNWYKEHASSGFDSRRNYSGGYEPTERYSSRGRTEESYRRSYRDVSDYSARDHSHHRSPESQRKRMRTEHYVQASSGRRSHEGSYGGGTDYNSRYSYAEDKGYGEDRSRGYRDDRRSTGFRDRSREDYPHRKADLDSGMPPPSSGPPRHVSSPRGSFRGRLSSRGARGMSRMTLIRRADAILSRKRSMMDSYSVRKRILTSRAQADSLRRLKIQKLRRMRELAAKKEAKAEKEGSGKGEDGSDDGEEEDGEVGEVEDWEAEIKKEEVGEDDEGTKEDKPKIKKKVKKATIVKEEEREEGEEIDEDDEEAADEEEDKEGDKIESPKKSETKSNIGPHDLDRAGSEEGKRTTFHGKPFIRLTCPHCFMRCITFKEYSIHLYSSKHIGAMRKQSLRLKQTLARMRMTQRQKQRIVEENEAEQGTLSSRTRFCPVCKLNYRQFKTKHQLSDYHRAMKKFLMPYCRVCRISFKSPMLFENHICSLDHIKREHWLKETKRMRERDRDDGSGMEDGDKEVNLDNFMTLDSVGTVDDDADEISGEEAKSKSDKEKKEGDEKKRTETNLGSEYIKKVEVLFCELCRTYLPRLDEPERALSIHCRFQPHLQRYVRYRDDRNRRREAERRKEAKEAAEKEKAEKKKDSGAEKMVDSTSEKAVKDEEGESKTKEGEEADISQGTVGEESSGAQGGDGGEGGEDLDQELDGSGMDDKLWADVDKDLGDLLREVQPGNKSSDEDEDSRAEGGRYDRFRYSEKGSSVAGPLAEGDTPDTTKAAVDGEGEAEQESETPEGAPEKDGKENEDQTETDAQSKKQSPTGPVSSAPVAVTTN